MNTVENFIKNNKEEFRLIKVVAISAKEAEEEYKKKFEDVIPFETIKYIFQDKARARFYFVDYSKKEIPEEFKNDVNILHSHIFSKPQELVFYINEKFKEEKKMRTITLSNKEGKSILKFDKTLDVIIKTKIEMKGYKQLALILRRIIGNKNNKIIYLNWFLTKAFELKRENTKDFTYLCRVRVVEKNIKVIMNDKHINSNYYENGKIKGFLHQVCSFEIMEETEKNLELIQKKIETMYSQKATNDDYNLFALENIANNADLKIKKEEIEIKKEEIIKVEKETFSITLEIEDYFPEEIKEIFLTLLLKELKEDLEQFSENYKMNKDGKTFLIKFEELESFELAKLIKTIKKFEFANLKITF